MKKFFICFLMLFVCLFVWTPNIQATSVNDIDPDIGGGVSTNPSKPNVPVTDYNRPDDFDTNCADFAPTLRMGGQLIFLVKVLLPLIIIGKATFDFAQIAISGASDQFKKQGKKLGVSLVGGIIIFFLPTLIYTMFSFISGFEENRDDDAKICAACVLDPFNPICTDHIN